MHAIDDERGTSSPSLYGRVLNPIANLIERGVLPVANATIAGLVFYQVVARYLFNSAPSWTEALARLVMIWMCYLGIGVTAMKKKEIVVEGILSFVGPRIERYLHALKDLIVLVFLVVLFYQSIRLAIMDRFITEAALEISWSWAYLAVTLGVLLYGLMAFPEIFKRLYRERTAAAAVALFVLVFYLVEIRFDLLSETGFSMAALTPVLMIFFLLIEMPVGFSLGVTAFYFILVQGRMPLMLMPKSFTHGADSFILMALPLFMLAAELMNSGGVTARIINFAMNLVGHVKGSLGHVSVATNMIMAGVSGSALADTAATGSVLIPEMEKEGFSKGFSSSIIIVAGAIGPVIPPSTFFILYGAVGDVSILKLFLAGAIPGLIMGLFIMAVIYVVARRRGYPVRPRATLAEFLLSLRDGLGAVFMPLFVIGGMVGGIFTATEAGSIAVFYALALGFYYRELTLKKIWNALSKTAVMVCAILVIVSMAHLVGYIASWTQVPMKVTDLFLSVSESPWIALLIVNILLLLIGCFESVIPTLIILTPILVPALSKLGVDPVHFGVVITLNLLIGLMSPPHGALLFMIMGIANIGMKELLRELWPFLLAILTLLGLVTYVPEIVLFLPRVLG